MSLRIYKKRCCGITQIAFISEHVQKLGDCPCDKPGAWVEQVIDPSCVHSTTTVTSTPKVATKVRASSLRTEVWNNMGASERRNYEL